MPRTVADLTEPELGFLADRHLGTLTTMRADGSPHVIAIAFVYDAGEGLVRIITSDNTQKVRNIERVRPRPRQPQPGRHRAGGHPGDGPGMRWNP